MLSLSKDSEKIAKFRRLVWDFYAKHGRAMPWRTNLDPYAVVVSEIMLQQTQVGRVTQKFATFLELFPNFTALAAASSADVVRAWQGLGYNRRALFLHKLAKTVEQDHRGCLPLEVSQLESLPGVGKATARSIATFAFNRPVVFIETNIRRVFLSYFYSDQTNISDTELLPFVEAALDHEHPREWYWALMDYGTHLANTTDNPNRRSRHYTSQSRFDGSRRQARGAIIRALTTGPKSITELKIVAERSGPEVKLVLTDLVSEGFVVRRNNQFELKS
jgi:A/G-specific adenine glycosylase